MKSYASKIRPYSIILSVVLFNIFAPNSLAPDGDYVYVYDTIP